MTASHRRAANVNTDVRVFWLGQVSAAATALAGTQVPRELSDSDGVTKILRSSHCRGDIHLTLDSAR